MSWYQDHKKAVIITSSLTATAAVGGLAYLAYTMPDQNSASKDIVDIGSKAMSKMGSVRGKIALAVVSTAVLGAGGAIYKYGARELAERAMGMFKRSH